MGISAFYGPPKPNPDRFALLDRAYAIGKRFWDTANIYGDSEDLLRDWFVANPAKRVNVFLATKFGVTVSESKDGDGSKVMIGKRSDPEYVREACERSLGVVWIDFFYVHRVDRVTPIEKTVEAMAELKRYVVCPRLCLVSKVFFLLSFLSPLSVLFLPFFSFSFYPPPSFQNIVMGVI